MMDLIRPMALPLPLLLDDGGAALKQSDPDMEREIASNVRQ